MSAQNGTLGSRGTQTDKKDVAYTTVEEVDDGCELWLMLFFLYNSLYNSRLYSLVHLGYAQFGLLRQTARHIAHCADCTLIEAIATSTSNYRSSVSS